MRAFVVNNFFALVAGSMLAVAGVAVAVARVVCRDDPPPGPYTPHH